MPEDARHAALPRAILTGLRAGESPRWHDGLLWFADWGTHRIEAVTPPGERRSSIEVPTTFPISIDWLPDGRMLAVAGPEQKLLRLESEGTFSDCADLSALGGIANEIVVADGGAYVNGGVVVDADGGMDGSAGGIVRVAPDGEVRTVASDIDFGNGMVITDNGVLVVAESRANRLTAFDILPGGGLSNRRVWAELGGRRPRRHLPRCGGRDLVCGRPEPTLRACARGRRGARHSGDGPRLFRLHARRRGRPDAVHARGGMARIRDHDREGGDRQTPRRGRTGRSRRATVSRTDARNRKDIKE